MSSLLLKNNSNSAVTSEHQIKEDSANQKMKIKWRIVTNLLNRLYINRMTSTWQRLKLIPFRWIRVQERMKKTIQNVFKKQDYAAKWECFQKVRRTSIAAEQKQVLHLKVTLQKQRGTAIRLLTAFVMGKRKRNFQFMVKKLKEVGDWKQFQLNTNYRGSIRTMCKIVNRKIQQSFNRLKDTRVILNFVKRCKNMVRLMRDVRIRNMRWAFVGVRREMLRNKKQKVGEEIKQLDEKLGGGEDEQLKTLKQKYNQFTAQLQEIKKQKQDITAGFEAEQKQAQNKNKEMKQTIEAMKAKQQEMKKRMLQIDQELKVPYSLEEIYQLCYQNLLWFISQNSQKTYAKEDLLKSLQTPLVPIDLPIDQLRQQNTVLRQLLSQYVLMYGQKKLPQNTKLELPYQYLLKQNNILYRMLMTLLPNAQFLKDQLLKIRESFEGVENSLKQLNYK